MQKKWVVILSVLAALVALAGAVLLVMKQAVEIPEDQPQPERAFVGEKSCDLRGDFSQHQLTPEQLAAPTE